MPTPPASTIFLPGALIAAALAALALATPAFADPGDVVARVDSDQADFKAVVVAEGLEFPWSLAFLPGGDILVTERGGNLRIVRAGALDPAPIPHGLDLRAVGQGGLLDVALHPDFAANRLVYLSYAKRHGVRQAGAALARGTLNADATALDDVATIFESGHRSTGRHFGGRLAWAPDGTLFLTLGDGGSHADDAQDPGNHWGTVVRLAADGTPAPGAPFADAAGALPEVWSYGHRNPQGAAIQPETGELWTHEHGARGGDEINIPRPGANHGWPAATYGIDYSGRPVTPYTARPGMAEPTWYWRPSIAPSGMAFYQGDAFPEWNGDLFVGALKFQQLQRFEVDGDHVIGLEVLLADFGERIRDVRSGPDGFLYLTTDSQNGRIIRLEPR